jgi:hypothetical protein
MADANHEHRHPLVLNAVNYAITANAKPMKAGAFASHLNRIRGDRVFGKGFDGNPNPILDWAAKG